LECSIIKKKKGTGIGWSLKQAESVRHRNRVTDKVPGTETAELRLRAYNSPPRLGHS
jgi:hypothetical protein